MDGTPFILATLLPTAAAGSAGMSLGAKVTPYAGREMRHDLARLASVLVTLDERAQALFGQARHH
jgi:hypothetical protein